MEPHGPNWVRLYAAVATLAMIAVGYFTQDARWAILAFVVVLFGLTAFKIASNIKKGGFGGEE